MRIPNRGEYRYFDEVGRSQELVRLRRENEALLSGEKYEALRRDKERMRLEYESMVKKLKRAHEKEMQKADAEIRELRRILSELTEDTLKELAKVKKDAYREVDKLLETIQKLEAEVGRCRERVRQHAKEKYEAQEELMKQSGENDRLRRLLAQDETNSSFPTSANKYNPRKKKRIANNRHKTGNKPGAQPGHVHHGRHWHSSPDEIIELSGEMFEGNALYRRTDKYVVKQVVGMRLVPHVIEYRAPVYRNKETEGRVHPPFPEGLHDEVQYDETVKAFCLYLTFICNTSAEKAAALIHDASGGRISPSHGFITGLLRELSEKTAPDRQVIWNNLSKCRSAHIDTSFVTQSGRQYPVTVFADQENAWFSATEHKGREAADSTPAKDSRAVLIHDEEATFQNYGTGHQDCLIHKCRRLTDAIQNEPDHTWHTDMKKLLTELLHWRKSWDTEPPAADEIARRKDEYDAIVRKGEKEYEYIPPSPYYDKAYTLLQKFKNLRGDILYFLDHPWIVPHNNHAERLLRKCKMKDRQAVTFRSPVYVEYFAHFLTYTQTQLMQGNNLYNALLGVFARPSVRPRAVPPASRKNA